MRSYDQYIIELRLTERVGFKRLCSQLSSSGGDIPLAVSISPVLGFRHSLIQSWWDHSFNIRYWVTLWEFCHLWGICYVCFGIVVWVGKGTRQLQIIVVLNFLCTILKAFLFVAESPAKCNSVLSFLTFLQVFHFCANFFAFPFCLLSRRQHVENLSQRCAVGNQVAYRQSVIRPLKKGPLKLEKPTWVQNMLPGTRYNQSLKSNS